MVFGKVIETFHVLRQRVSQDKHAPFKKLLDNFHAQENPWGAQIYLSQYRLPLPDHIRAMIRIRRQAAEICQLAPEARAKLEIELAVWEDKAKEAEKSNRRRG